MPAKKSFTISAENHAHATVAAATSVNPAFHHTLEPTTQPSTQPSAQPDTDRLRVRLTAVLLRKQRRPIITPDAMHLTGLFLYPVKSFRGCAVSAADVDALGLVGDRRFLVVDEHGAHLTQRPLPRMALISTALDPTHLTLSADGAASVRIPRHSSLDPYPATLRTVSIWRSQGLLAEDCGREVSAWLSAFLGVTCHLVRIGEKFRRPVLDHPAFTAAPANTPISDDRIMAADLFNFSDGYPFLVVSEASLAHLNDRLVSIGEEPVPMDRFRPSLVVSGCSAHAEDTWSRLRIGDITFRSGGPCARCTVVTTDQLTGERGHEPLRTLASYRRDPTDSTRINFALNLTHETKSGTLRLGDAVELLKM
ncbi:MAG: hypothetical protein RLZZ162_2307 [Verrucomicrobiota bacterium]